MPLITKGFVNRRQLNLHFQLHGADFGAENAGDYQVQADMFLSGTAPDHIHQCFRQKGDTIRYDPQTQAFGVLDGRGVIRTFFKPVPCATLHSDARVLAKQAGRCHGHTNNFQYFRAECKRW
jgi:pyocin large subunit-like protein